MHARFALGVLGLLALGACNDPTSGRTADYSPPPPTPEESQQITNEAAEEAAAEAAKPARIGKRHLSSYTINMTKAQVREFLGSPAEVGSEDPFGRVSWFYWNLPVYDEEAGTQAKVVRFTFEQGRVVEVGF
ncbi:MAG: outer membrane protein assembly factor BamE [Caulobacter sp.]|nr:outer membrane protein assembly factor BamE [Caulobacter sp.]